MYVDRWDILVQRFEQANYNGVQKDDILGVESESHPSKIRVHKTMDG